jgi:hypothetical protein
LEAVVAGSPTKKGETRITETSIRELEATSWKLSDGEPQVMATNPRGIGLSAYLKRTSHFDRLSLILTLSAFRLGLIVAMILRMLQ